MTLPTSFRARRALLRRLCAAHATRPAGADPQPVAEAEVGDPAFGDLFAHARKFVPLLRQAPPAPPVLRHPDFLGASIELALRASARSIGPALLRRAFAPALAPRDVTWSDDPTASEAAGWMPLGLPRLPRSARSFRRPPMVRPRRPRWVVLAAAAAAILLAAGAFITLRGTSSNTELVFVVANGPLSADHPSDFLRGLISR